MVVGFDIGGVEPSGSTTKVLVYEGKMTEKIV
jgi:hypothetical protein